jgi:hypothetical protein
VSVRRAYFSRPQQCILPAPGLARKFVKSTHQGKATATGQELRGGASTVAPRHHTGGAAGPPELSDQLATKGQAADCELQSRAVQQKRLCPLHTGPGRFVSCERFSSFSGEAHTVGAPGQVVKEPNVARAKTEDAIRTLRGLPPPEGSFLRRCDGHGVGGSWPQCGPQKHNSRIKNDGNHAPSQIDERHATHGIGRDQHGGDAAESRHEEGTRAHHDGKGGLRIEAHQAQHDE